mmetsp:Transcript_64149/g.126234  ORF Transcript_64149/g.126234 Transcript_64149/m.126234 type:complete len:298 (-) Transcript_64149:94-987(-)
MPHSLVERLRLFPVPCRAAIRLDKPDARDAPAVSEAPSGSWRWARGSVDCVVETVETLASFIFLIGSLCFLPGWVDDVRIFLLGCELFVLGGFLLVVLSVATLFEALKAKGWGNEASEHVMYLVGSLLFLAGTILYWPEQVGDEHIQWMKGCAIGVYLNLFSPEFEGTLLFIAGSMLFAVAALINGMSTNVFSHRSASPGKRLLLASASLYLIGSLLFVVGSVAWLPDLGFGRGGEAIGAWTFVVGSAAYLLGGLLSLLRVAGYLEAGVGAGADETAPLVAAAAMLPSPKLPRRVLP